MLLTLLPWLHHLRQEVQAVQERAEAVLTLSDRAWVYALGEAGELSYEAGRWPSKDREKKGLRRCVRAWRPAGPREQSCGSRIILLCLAEAYGKAGQVEEGLSRAGRGVGDGEQNWGAFVRGGAVSAARGANASVWAKGRVGQIRRQKSNRPRPQSPTRSREECFLKAIDIARKQQAKSWELRASISLARLWQQQGKKAEAHKLLSDVYNWFTEGFDTKDLQEAKALLEELKR